MAGGDAAAVTTAFEALTIPGGATPADTGSGVAPDAEVHAALGAASGGGADAADPGAPTDRDFAAVAFDVFDPNCPSRAILEHVTGRWGVLVLGGLSRGPIRFNALRRRVSGVSEKMLAQTLHALERDGFVSREVRSTIPPRVEYTLTDLGQQAAVLLRDLVALVEAHGSDVLAAQRHYDAEHPDH